MVALCNDRRRNHGGPSNFEDDAQQCSIVKADKLDI